MNEVDFQRRITDLCDWLHLRWHHETDSRRSKEGFPDLVIVGNSVIFAELKASKRKPTPAQQSWLTSLTRAGVAAYLWYPEDWDFIEARLRSLALS